MRAPTEKRFLAMLALAVIGLLLGGPKAAAQGGVNTVCPVMPDEEIAGDAVTVVHEGKDVRLCCKRCRAKFLADPDRYLDELPQFASTDGGRQHEHDDASGGDNHDHDDHGGDVLSYVGRFHPVVVHFPIGLLVFATLLEGWALLRRREPYGPAVRPLVLWGAVSAVGAVLLGFALARTSDHPGEMLAVFERHRLLGVVTAALALLALGLADWGRARRRPWGIRTYLALLLVCTATLAVAAHHGGLLVYGLNYFS